MKKCIILLFFSLTVFADNPPSYFVLRIEAKMGAVDSFFYTYYNPYIYSNENSTNVLKFDSMTKHNNESDYYNTGDLRRELYMPDSIYCSDTIIQNGKLSFAFAKGSLIDMSNFDSIRIDSILWGEATKSFQMLDSKSYKQLTCNGIVNTYDVFTYDEGSHYLYLRVISFDSIWVNDYFMSQFEGYKVFVKTINSKTDNFFKQQRYWNYYENVLKKEPPKLIEYNDKSDEYQINTKNLPNDIRLAVNNNKIIIFPYRD